MIARGRPGLIINTGSKQGITTPPGDPAYNVAKAGVKAFTESLQHELRNTKECRISAHLFIPGFVFTGIAEATMNSPDAQRWLPGMVSRLREKRQQPGADGDLARCAQRCVDLAAGRFDALSGRYMELGDDLQGMLRDVAK